MKKRVSYLLLFSIFVNVFLSPTAFASNHYKDQGDISKWAIELVDRGTEDKIVSGYNGYFYPKKNITRGEFIKLIVEGLDIESSAKSVDFKDVKTSDWFYSYLVIGWNEGIIEGSDGYFYPNKNISREDMAVILSRALKIEGYSEVDLKDLDQISSWAVEDVKKVVDRKLITGYGGSFDPKSYVTREMATVVSMRARDYARDTTGPIAKNIGRDLDKGLDYLEKNTVNPTVSTVSGEWALIGLNRSGRKIKTLNQEYLNNLEAILREKDGKLHKTRYTEYSRVVLFLNALGENPRDIFGYNLEENILDLKNTKKQGINGPIFSLIALNSSSSKLTREKEIYIDYILSQQLSNGGWSLSGDRADIDVTAMALQALAPFKKSEKVGASVERALGYLSSQQASDGGFTSWNTKNSENVSQVIIALSSLGIDPDKDPRFVKGKRSLVDFLLDYQLASGGFKHEPRGKEDLMATEQGVLALLSYERFLKGQPTVYSMQKDK